MRYVVFQFILFVMAVHTAGLVYSHFRATDHMVSYVHIRS